MQVIESNPPNADYAGDIESVHISYKKSNTNQCSCPDYGLYTNQFWNVLVQNKDVSRSLTKCDELEVALFAGLSSRDMVNGRI